MSDFNAFCRTCMFEFKNSPSGSLTECYNIFKTKNLAKKITQCSQLITDPTDGYPEYICKKCYANIKILTDFQRTCRDSARVYRELLSIGKQEGVEVAEALNKVRESKKMHGLKQSKASKMNAKSKHSHDGEYVLEDTYNDNHLIELNFNETIFEDSFENDHQILFESDSEPGPRNLLKDIRDLEREVTTLKSPQYQLTIEKDFDDQNAIADDFEIVQHMEQLKKDTPQEMNEKSATLRQIYKCDIIGCGLEYSNKQDINFHFREQHFFGKIIKHDEKDQWQEFSFKQNNRKKNKKKLNKNKSTFLIQSSSEEEESISDEWIKSQKLCREFVSIQCEICEKQFRYMHRFDAHMRRHQGLRGYPCPRENCERTFNRLSYLQIHLNDHDGVPRTIYKCDFENCDRSYSCKSALNSHKRLYHSGKSSSEIHICETCGAALKSAGALKFHLLTHLDKSKWQFVCDFEGCNKRFKVFHHLKVHKRRHAGIKNYTCPYCDKRFVTRSNMNNHINHHTSEKTWSCDFCPLISKTPANLRTHIRRVHEQRPYDDPEMIKTRGFKCSFCEKTFPSASGKKYHEFRHTGEKPYACEECDKRFRQPAGLKIHMKTHKKDATRTFVCGECGRAYLTIQSLKNHEMKHTGEKPYTCDECGFQFIWKSNLNRHQKRHQRNSVADNKDTAAEVG